MLVDEISQLVQAECEQYLPYFWLYHMVPMTAYASELAEKTNADQEIVGLAALLHDLTWLRGDKSGNHNITASDEAKKILSEREYPEDRALWVADCILSHRGEKTDPARKTVEAECVASADVLAHLDSIPALLYYCYVDANLSIEKAVKWLKAKLERGWDKLIPEAKELANDKYDAAMLLFKAFEKYIPQE